MGTSIPTRVQRVVFMQRTRVCKHDEQSSATFQPLSSRRVRASSERRAQENVGWRKAPHRVLRNKTVETWEAAGRPPSGARPGEGEVIARSRSGGEIVRYQSCTPGTDTEGDIDALSLWAGQSVGLVSEIKPAGEYWPRLGASILPRWVGEMVSPTDMPVDAREDRRFPQADDRERTLEHAYKLLDAAQADKRRVIPTGAIIQLPFGPFRSFEIHEVGEQIGFVARTHRGEFLWVTCTARKIDGTCGGRARC